MRNFKTDKGFKVILDYVDRCYDWKEVRDFFDLDGRGIYVRMEGTKDLPEIDDLGISEEGLNRLLWRTIPIGTKNGFNEEEFESDPNYYETYYGEFERKYEIRPFYISYYGSGNYRVQFCTGEEASGIILIERNSEKKDKSLEFAKKIFEHYIDGEFYFCQIYSPHKAFFEEGKLREKRGITFYDFKEEGGIFYLDQQEAIDGIPEECGKILRDTESPCFEAFELNHKEKLII